MSVDVVRRLIEDRFNQGRVLVVGDLMLDLYLWGDVIRISPEAPVPIMRLSRRSEAAGGAGNVASNLAALGLHVTVAGVIGDDDAGSRLGRLLAGMEVLPVTASDGRPTVTKTRVIGGRQQMLRIDEEPSGPLPTGDENRLLEVALPVVERAQAVVLSDYAKGALPARVCRELVAAARRAGKPVLVDPKGMDFGKYARATVLTPNVHELEQVAGKGELTETALRDVARRLREDLEFDFLALTRGEAGVSLFDEQGDRDFPAVARALFDVSGAGDTLIATLTAGLAGSLARDDAVRLANMAAGIAVGKVGTAPVSRDELLSAWNADPLASQRGKVCDCNEMVRRAAQWRRRAERIVFTNGCFDLLHVGHVTLLAQARAAGDRLVIGLNSDRSVQGLKGEGRPVVSQADRARVLAGFADVDAVVIFDEPTPIRLVEALRPDVLVKGADYTESEIAGAAEVRSWGGNIVLIPLVEGWSTTQLLTRRS